MDIILAMGGCVCERERDSANLFLKLIDVSDVVNNTLIFVSEIVVCSLCVHDIIGLLL